MRGAACGQLYNAPVGFMCKVILQQSGQQGLMKLWLMSNLTSNYKQNVRELWGFTKMEQEISKEMDPTGIT